MITVLVHISNADPIKCDIEDLPKPSDNVFVGKNVREKGDKDLEYTEEGVNTLIIPWWRITFIEVLPSADDEVEFPLPFRND
ncbi:MAG: hypothetical protein IAE80_05630 [Anaerolinea sp.]|nr:hypothetical protein [Anaerolinea sp.]